MNRFYCQQCPADGENCIWCNNRRWIGENQAKHLMISKLSSIVAENLVRNMDLEEKAAEYDCTIEDYLQIMLMDLTGESEIALSSLSFKIIEGLCLALKISLPIPFEPLRIHVEDKTE